MSYLNIDVALDKVGNAFDAIRQRDDTLCWSACGAKFIRGINPLKAISREYLENYLASGIKGRVHLSGERVNTYATELAFRFGNGIVRRTRLPYL